MFKVRYNVFETNSSSVHSLVMCSENEYEDFLNDKLLYDYWNDKFVTRKEALDKLYNKTRDNLNFKYRFGDISRNELDSIPLDELQYYLANECYLYTSDYYFNEQDFEAYTDTYTTKNGEVVRAFGYFGHD